LSLRAILLRKILIDELNKNIQKALDLYVSEPEHSKEFAAFPNLSINKSKTIVEVVLDLEIAFSFPIRYLI